MTDVVSRQGVRTRTIGLLGVGWTLLAALSLLWSFRCLHRVGLEFARVRVRAAIHEDDLYRRWNARHGGIYVEVAEDVAADPHLEVAGERTWTEGGRRLRLLHHVGMSRMVHDRSGERGAEVLGHVSSLHPLRTRNAPDSWERGAFAAFGAGAEEASRVRRVDGHQHMFLMRPLRTEAGCLHCHEAQGHVVGDIRGAVTLAAPLAPIDAVIAPLRRDATLVHVSLWLAGLGLMSWGARTLRRLEGQWGEATLEGTATRRALAASRQALRRQKQESERSALVLSSVAKRVPDGVVLLDASRNAVLTNATAVRLLGADSEARSHAVTPMPAALEAYDPALADAVEKVATQVRRGPRPLVETGLSDRSWSVSPVLGAADEVQGVLVILRDLTESRALEREAEDLRARMRRQERLALAGILATALADELREPLDGILLEGRSLRRSLQGAEESGALGAIVVRACACRDIVHRLLDFARVRRSQPTPLDLARPLERVVRLSEARLEPRGVDLLVTEMPGVPRVEADPDHVEQVLLNLVANAADAMPDGGRIEVRLFEEAGSAVLEILDEGVGIPEDLQGKVFEPFFTTKPPGKGTGLGLGICRRIVEEHRGVMEISARSRGGTRVRITLPPCP